MNKIIIKNLGVIIFFVIFYIAVWFFLTYRITEVPPGINGDEAVIGYNAALVARSDYDSNGKFLPLFTAAPNSTDWKQPVTFYSEVLAFRLFGPSYFVLRAVSVFFVLLSGVIIFLLNYELFGLKGAIGGLLIFLTTPIIMIQSHLAIENIAPVPFIAFWLLMLVKYSQNLKVKYVVFGGIALALSIYSYLGLKLMLPFLVGINLLFIYFLNKRSTNIFFQRSLILLLTITPFLVILLLLKNAYPGSFLGLYRPYNITSYQQFILPYISTFDPSFLFIQGDVTPYHSTGKHGMFLLASLPLFVLGLINILQKKYKVQILIMTSFFLMPVLFGIASDIHRASRLLSLIPPYIVVSSSGLMFLINLKNKIWRYICILTVILLILFNFTDFLRDYWYEYPNRIKSDFSKPYHLVFEKAYSLSKSNNLTPYIQSDFRKQDLFAEDFFEQVYFPEKLKLWQDNQPLPENSVIIVSDFIMAKNPDIKQIKIGDGYFGVLINSKNGSDGKN